MIAYFERFTIEMTLKQAESASHQGRCDEDVLELSKHPQIKRQMKKLAPELLAAELKEYGAWDEKELQDHDANIQRILWIAASNIKEDHRHPQA